MKTIHPIIIGIDTHKATHVAVAIDTQGARLAALSIPTNPKGYLESTAKCGALRRPFFRSRLISCLGTTARTWP